MPKYRKMAVIFIDLLGTKNNKRFEDKYYIHRLFHEEAKKNEERNPAYVTFNRCVNSFSDCAYFFYYYKGEDEDHDCEDDMKMLQVAMYNTSISILRILNSGYLVRGGVAFGNAYIDELGFFGPAVEEAYKLESAYADVPMIALSDRLGKEYTMWEDKTTDMKMVDLMFTSRPRMVEKSEGKYFLNVFYQLEAFNRDVNLETERVDIDILKYRIQQIIDRDREKYKGISWASKESKKSTIVEKLDWMEKYISERHNRLRKDVFSSGISMVMGD